MALETTGFSPCIYLILSIKKQNVGNADVAYVIDLGVNEQQVSVLLEILILKKEENASFSFCCD